MLAHNPPLDKPNRGYRPDFIADNVQSIDFTYLRSRGIRNCLIDLDGTVVRRGTYAVSPEVIHALQASGMKIVIATNRLKGSELKNLREDLSAVGVTHPRGIFAKPSRRYYAAALSDFSCRAAETVMIGDRYFQDIFGANRAGLYSLLVPHIEGRTRHRDRPVNRLQDFLTRRISPEYRAAAQ